MPMVPNRTALAEGFAPVRADEVLEGDVIWIKPLVSYSAPDPVMLPDGRILVGTNIYDAACRVYVAR